MNYWQFGRVGWQVSEIGYGMWGMGGWTESDDAESLASLQAAVDLGCNFFDTAYIYGNGHSEGLLGQLLKANPQKRLYTATKIPPMNPVTPESKLDECFPADHIEEYIHKSLANLGIPAIDLIQFHFWQDAWAEDDRWAKTMTEMKRQKLVNAVGISINRGQPWNGIRTVNTGLLDSVQVVYNIFDQNPEDELFPACRKQNVAVIARVPFDEGSLTGTLTPDSHWPEGDWRNTYFTPDKLKDTLERVEKLKTILPAGMTLPELALRFILSHPDVSTVIPGMRKPRHVAGNLACSDAIPLPEDLLLKLKEYRWVRTIKK
jgi:aryl-alcohol dehydrogenase-like predicted oxidoreductase